MEQLNKTDVFPVVAVLEPGDWENRKGMKANKMLYLAA